MLAATKHGDWLVEALWRDPQTGSEHIFLSEPLDELDAGRYPVGSPITVLVDLSDPLSYHVEIEQ